MTQRYSKKVIESMGSWLSGQSWTHWATFTTGYELTLPSARRAMHRMHSNLDLIAPAHMFWASEPFDAKEGYHTHALLKVNEALGYKDIIEMWQKVSKGGKGKWNRVDLQLYDDKLGAGYYLSKYITKQLSDYDYLVSGSSRNYSLKRL